MSAFSFFRWSIPLLLTWACSVPSAFAATGGSASAERPVAQAETVRGHTDQPLTAGTGDSTRDSDGRVLFILGSSRVHGTSTIPASISFDEVVHAWDVFDAAGYPVDFVSPDGGAVPILDGYVGDAVADRLKDERIMRGLRDTTHPSQIDPDQYLAVYYVGGSNAMYGVAGNPALQRIAMQVYERNGGVVSAVCHGTAGIVDLTLADGRYLVAGRRITGYPEEYEQQDAAYFREFPFLIRKTIEDRGGLFRVLDRDQSHVEVDGRLVTGQNYPSAGKVAEAVVAILRGKAG